MTSKTKVQPSGSSHPPKTKRGSFIAMTRRSSLGSIEAKFSHGCCRSVIIFSNAATLLLGLLFALLGGLVVSNAPNNPPAVSMVLIVLGGVLSAICIMALVAGCRVKKEMKEKNQLEIWTARSQKATCSQKTLNIYFFLTLLIVPILLLTGIWILTSLDLAIATFAENCNNFDAGGVQIMTAVKDFCQNLNQTQFVQALQGAAGLCFLASGLQMMAALGSVRIVTLFAIMQSLLQMINLFFMIFGYAIAFFGGWAIHLNGLQGGDGFGNEVYYIVIAIGGTLCIMALIGYMAAHRESKILLWVYGIVCLILLTAAISVGIHLSSAGNDSHHVHEFVRNNCDELVVTMDETWFKDSLFCDKYVGESEYVPVKESTTTNVSVWATHPGPGIVTTCQDISTTKFAWEYNLGLTMGDREQMHFDEDGKSVAYHGCINRGCCDLIERSYAAHKTYLGIALFVVAILVAFACVAACFMARTKAKLRNEGFTDDSPLLLHSQDVGILCVIILLFVVGLVVGIWMVTGTTINKNTLELQEIGQLSNLASNIKPMESATVRCDSSLSSSANNHTCSSCTDGVKGGDETCIDGGGSCVTRCSVGQACTKQTDCEAQLMCSAMTCQRPENIAASLCNNGVLDVISGHVESGIDCGHVCGSLKLCALAERCSSDNDCADEANCIAGTCTDCIGKCGGVCPDRCDAGESCSTNSDCIDGVQCFQTVCASCSDGIKSGDETCIDGGSSLRHPLTGKLSKLSLGCGSCADSGHCKHDLDCLSSSHCDNATKTCSSCSNSVKDGSETSVDCGGDSCQQCELNKVCKKSQDCITQRCVDGVCKKPVSSTCQDGVLTVGAGETCVDGGGATCRMLGKRCGDGGTCLEGNDCASGNCFHDLTSNALLGTCVNCTNGVQDVGEVDIDCGGLFCGKCSDSNACLSNDDCNSNACVAGTCVSCHDSLQNQLESCIDGGSVCSQACDDGQTCFNSNDCKTGSTCVNGICSSCSNNILDGNETDIDCGGPLSCSKPCRFNQQCAAHDDCVTGWCNTSSICAAIPASVTCTNGLQDNGEVAIDCGGPACVAIGRLCEDESACNVDHDCLSGKCTNSVCGDLCKNQFQDQDETFVDCGGATCARCKDTESCLKNSDCQSNSCDSISKQCISCSDGLKTGEEVDVDCGGGFCGRCSNTKKCLKNSDCLSQNCFVVPTMVLQTHNTLMQFGFETLRVQDGSKLMQQFGVDTGLGQMFDESDPSIVAEIEQSHRPETSGVCVSCSDGVRNGEESDQDCGGTRCKKCANAEKCKSNTDCLSEICSPMSGICVRPPTQEELCSNGVKDVGKESDTDCGLVCGKYGKKCEDKQTCTQHNDCQSLQCSTFGVCISCSDGIQNGREFCVDGGGRCSKGCDAGSSCLHKSDCNSKRCETVGASSSTKQCVNCDDGLKSGNEVFADVAGPCPLAKSGSQCLLNSNCQSNQCVNEICQDCFNNVKDGWEDDVDCGFSCDKKCAKLKTCTKHESCVTGYCSSTTLTCEDVPPTEYCSNGQLDVDQGETCLDAGGPGCRNLGHLCSNGASCQLDVDCTSSNCYNGTCVSCFDGVKNGDESSSDCGGACKPCDDLRACVTASDCFSGQCSSNICRSCSDGIKNGDEQDVDCGGSGCPKCADGNTCAESKHCLSGICASNTCSSCSNVIKDGLETDLNCGGTDCKPCALTKMCQVSNDCITDFCDSNDFTCKQPTPEVFCNNSIIDEDRGETSLNCGGLGCRSIGKTCDVGQSCKIDTDCSTGICDALTCVDCKNKCATHHARCNRCVDGETCTASSECRDNSICEHLKCVSHSDNLQNFNESGIDCGGPDSVASRCGVGASCTRTRDCELGLACSSQQCTVKKHFRLESTVQDRLVFSSSKLNAGCATVENVFRLTASLGDSPTADCTFRAVVTVTNRASVRVGTMEGDDLDNTPLLLSENTFSGNFAAVNKGLSKLSMCPFCGHASHTLSARVVVLDGPCTLSTNRKLGATVGVQVDVESEGPQIFLGAMKVHGATESSRSLRSLNVLARSSNCAMSLIRVNHDAEFQITLPHSELGPICATVEVANEHIKPLLVHVARRSGATSIGLLHVHNIDDINIEQDAYFVTGKVHMDRDGAALDEENPIKLEIYQGVVQDINCIDSIATAFKSYDIHPNTGAYETGSLSRGMYTLIVRNANGYHPFTRIIHVTGDSLEHNENIHLIPNADGLHIQAEWDSKVKNMQLYVGFKASTMKDNNGADIFCRVFNSRASCADTVHVRSHESSEMVHIKTMHTSVYTIFVRNYEDTKPSEVSKLKVSLFNQTQKLAEYGLPTKDRTNYMDYIWYGDEKFDNGLINTETPHEFQQEARFIRVACIAKDGAIHAAPQYSYHQTNLLDECPPKNIKYCAGTRALKLLAPGTGSNNTGITFSDGSNPGHHYLNGMKCRFDVTAPTGYLVEVTFPRFDLEKANAIDSLCKNDFVEIDGLKYCGNNRPRNLLLQAPFSVRFQTDQSTTNLGFHGRLTLVDVKTMETEQCSGHNNCGGCLSETTAGCSWCASSRTCLPSSTTTETSCSNNAWAIGEPNQCLCSKRTQPVPLVNVEEGKQFTFQDGSSLEDNYAPNSNCKWTIAIPNNKWMKITLVSFDVEAGTQSICPYDSLNIGDQSFCGHQPKDKTICHQSSSTSTTTIPTEITFKTDATSQFAGFVANYEIGTAIDLGCAPAAASPPPITTMNHCTCKSDTPVGCHPPNDVHWRAWCQVEPEPENTACEAAYQDFDYDPATLSMTDPIYVDYCLNQEMPQDTNYHQMAPQGYGAAEDFGSGMDTEYGGYGYGGGYDDDYEPDMFDTEGFF